MIEFLSPKAQIAIMNSKGGQKLLAQDKSQASPLISHAQSKQKPIPMRPNGTTFASHLKQSSTPSDFSKQRLEAEVDTIVEEFINHCFSREFFKQLWEDDDNDSANGILGEYVSDQVGRDLTNTTGFLHDLKSDLKDSIMKNFVKKR